MQGLQDDTTDHQLSQLADLNSRQVCPRCQGYSFVHTSMIKHDKSHLYERCKNCIDCQVCDQTGIIVNKMACPVCRANGFIHPSHVDPHCFPFRVQCTLCISCPECMGMGIMEPNRYHMDLNSAQRAVPSIPQPNANHNLLLNLSLTYSMSSVHPHLRGMMKHLENSIGRQELQNRLKHIGSFIQLPVSPVIVHAQHHQAQREQQELIVQESKKKSSPNYNKSKCFKCLGRTWVHQQPFVHDKTRKEKCKHCLNCKICSGSGVLVNKKICRDCGGNGYTHSSNHTHDVPEHLRCFYCQDCMKCLGSGVVSLQDPLTPPLTPKPKP